MGSLLAVYDPTGRLGLTDPSPGGGSVPVVWICLGCRRVVECGGVCCTHIDGMRRKASLFVDALLLVTEDGTPDPVGMARAREVLARVMGFNPSSGVLFDITPRGWQLDTANSCLTHIGPVTDESAPEALARLLAERAGCEVVRG